MATSSRGKHKAQTLPPPKQPAAQRQLPLLLLLLVLVLLPVPPPSLHRMKEGGKEVGRLLLSSLIVTYTQSSNARSTYNVF